MSVLASLGRKDSQTFDHGYNLCAMNTRREIARRIVETVMASIADDIREEGITITQAAETAGVPKSTFYRWMSTHPKTIDVTGISAVAQLLHDEYGHDDFAVRWRRAEKLIESEESQRQHVDGADTPRSVKRADLLAASSTTADGLVFHELSPTVTRPEPEVTS